MAMRPSEQLDGVIDALDALDAGARLAFRPANGLLGATGFSETRRSLVAARSRAIDEEANAEKAGRRLAERTTEAQRLDALTREIPEGGRL